MEPIIIAGPCAAESAEQLTTIAEQLSHASRRFRQKLSYFRAGVWKPRSHPDSFTGMGEEALPILSRIEKQYGVPVCVEVMNVQQVELCERHGIHTVWVGARTGVNPIEVQALADALRHKPFTVMVKNPIVPDLKLWAGNVERFLKADVAQVMAIHRGCPDNTENVFRNAPCWELAIDMKVQFPDIPLLCDPSHLCGHTRFIRPVAQIALNYGFNGLMLECHHAPEQALSDAAQQLTPEELQLLLNQLNFTTDTPNHDLIKQRALLENIDIQLSELLSQRMQVIDKIADIKNANQLPIVQPQQWQQVRNRYIKPEQDDNYQAFINEFLELLHQASIKRQNH